MRKIIEITAGKGIKLADYGIVDIKRINYLWTVYDEDQMWDFYARTLPEGTKVDRSDVRSLKLRHQHGAFLEDYIHDWDADYDRGLLHYYSRLVDQGEKIKILLDYSVK